MHIALPIGDGNIVMANDVLQPLGQQLMQGNNLYVSVHPASREADRDIQRSFRGGRDRDALRQLSGDYYGSLKDKFGVMCMVNYGPPREE